MMDEREKDAMRKIGDVHQAILGLGLQVNQQELVCAIHVLQGFVIQRMLQRINPEEFAGWWFK